MKILIIDGSDNRFEREVDTFELTGRCIRLYKNISHNDEAIARPAEDKLIAAYWGITGFEVLEDN